MYPSNLIELQTARDAIDAFRGYNHNRRIGDGEWYDMQNLTSDDYPVLSPRRKRGEHEYPVNPLQNETHKPLCMIAKDSLFYIDKVNGVPRLFKNNYEITLQGVTITNEEPKQMVSMGAYVIVMPDKIWFNSLSETAVNGQHQLECGYIDQTFSTYSNARYALVKDADGTAFTNSFVRFPTAPENEEALWIDTSTTPGTPKIFNKTTSAWTPLSITYIQIGVDVSGLDDSFEVGDSVYITGINTSLSPGLEKISSTQDKAVPLIIQGKGKDNAGNPFIVVNGSVDYNVTQTNDNPNTPTITIKRRMPDLDFIIESKNRLWGCRYGQQGDAGIVNEIYCSKLGDFKNWNSFAGISTDSWVASCGTDGAWTGAITHNGYPIFFKENHMHKVYGDYPAEYRIQDSACRGVEAGSGKSLAIVNEVLYYKSRNGICAYDGSLPIEVSAALGEEKYSSAVAGDLDNKYYVSMKDEDGKYHLFVYDTRKDMWHREDNTQAKEFCRCRNDLYFIDGDKIKTVKGTGKEAEGAVEWYAESGDIGLNMLDQKFISRLLVRMSLSPGSTVAFYIKYDSCGSYEPVGNLSGNNLRTFTLQIRPKRCDHFRLKIFGKGEAKIYSISKTIEQGSDLQ